MSSTTQMTSDRNNDPVQLDLDSIRDSACSHLGSIDVLVALLRVDSQRVCRRASAVNGALAVWVAPNPDGRLPREHKFLSGSGCAADPLNGRTASHLNRRTTFSFILRQNDMDSREEVTSGKQPPGLC